MFSIFESFFVLNLETKLHQTDAAVARCLATPVAGLLESADGVNPEIHEPQEIFSARIARITAKDYGRPNFGCAAGATEISLGLVCHAQAPPS
jgi:hypothetical protein